MIELSVVSELLRELLRAHNRVSLPGLGAFMVDRASASFVKGGKAVLPPSKHITFSTLETWNDGLLEQAVAREEGYTPEGAKKHLEEFSQKIAGQLEAGQRVEFPELGTLRITADREWRFIPLETSNVDADSFGLLELELNPLTPEEPLSPKPAAVRYPTTPYVPPKRQPIPPVAAEPPRKFPCSAVCWVLLILVVLIAGVCLFSRPILKYIESVSYTPEELAYIYGEDDKTPPPEPVLQPVTPEPVAAPIAEPVVEKTEPDPAPTPVQVRVQEKKVAPTFAGKTRPYNKFHIMVAQYDDEDIADTYAQKIKKNYGYAAAVVHTGGETPYKVSVLRYTSKDEAEEILSSIKITDPEFQNAWVEKY
jgi:nucleoid DNA-binding protein